MGEAAPHLRPPQPRRRRPPPWHGDGETSQKPLPSLRRFPRLRSPTARMLAMSSGPSSPPKSLTSPLPGSRERPVPDSPIAGSQPLLTAQPSGRAVPYILQL